MAWQDVLRPKMEPLNQPSLLRPLHQSLLQRIQLTRPRHANLSIKSMLHLLPQLAIDKAEAEDRSAVGREGGEGRGGSGRGMKAGEGDDVVLKFEGEEVVALK